MKLCLYQGTFNPIHNAHLKVANFVYEHFDFEKIIFIPAYKPPHKHNRNYDEDSAMHRLNLINLAIEPYKYFESSDIEYKRAGTSYTYLTIQELYKRFDITGKINFIIGTDAFQHIESWYEADKLKELIDFILFVREDEFDEEPFKRLKIAGFNYRLAKMPYLDISSSEVRQKVKNCANIDSVVPDEVAKYIHEHQLYRT